MKWVVSIVLVSALSLSSGCRQSKELTGSWRATDELASQMFGVPTYVQLNLNGDGSANLLTDPGTWKKVGGGIEFHTDSDNSALAIILLTSHAKPSKTIFLDVNEEAETLTWILESIEG